MACRKSRRQLRDSPYTKFLKVNKFDAPNVTGWSGCGNHVEFENSNKVPLELGQILGQGSYSVVQRVLCTKTDSRPLAQKLIWDYRKGGIEKVMTEVKCIQNLRHRHVVQLVGTYVVDYSLHILLFPVGQWNLRQFLQEFEDGTMESKAYPDFYSLGTFFKCLACGVAYLHDEVVPHIINLDIKPENIIVRRCSDRQLTVFITDFGVSRSFQPTSPSTDVNTIYTTPIYQAPEIAKKELYGRKADIFSLGCVFSEMASILAGRTLKEYSKHREHSRPESTQPSVAFESSIPACITWLLELKSLPPFKRPSSGQWWKYLLDRIKTMMSMEPDERYSSDQLVNTFPPGPCCQVSLEEYQSLLQPQSQLLPRLSEELNGDNSSDRESTALTLASTEDSYASDPDTNKVAKYLCGEKTLEGHTSAFTEVNIAPIPEPQLAQLLETPGSEASLLDFDWSGKGAHVQYESQTEVPLHIIELLGLGASSSVHKVRTTINGSHVFAQKMLETRGHLLRLEMLMKEVKVLQRLRHPHIVRLIGTAFDTRFFSILTYPAADWTLANFLEIVGAERSSGDLTTREYKQALHKFTTCLINALDYLHRQGIRHKDIKPSNILVQRWGADEHGYHVYLSDFGISTQMASDDISVTIGPTSYTPRYASPETLSFESRGRASDIFSMGCVWIEIYTVIIGERLATLHDELGFLTNNSDDSGSESSEEYSSIHEKSRHGYSTCAPYAKNLKGTIQWIQRLRGWCYVHHSLIGGEAGKFSDLDVSVEDLVSRLNQVERMIEKQPNIRPNTAELCTVLGSNECCTADTSPYDFEISSSCDLKTPPTSPTYILNDQNASPVVSTEMTYSPAHSTHSSSGLPYHPQKADKGIPSRTKASYKLRRWVSLFRRPSISSPSSSPKRTLKLRHPGSPSRVNTSTGDNVDPKT